MKPSRLKLPKWKIAAFSIAVLLGVGVIVLYQFLKDPPDEDPDNSSYNLNKTVIEAGMGGLDSASLSPDGSTVLIDRRTHTISWRPSVDLSQQGNAVLVSWPGFSTKRLKVFTIK